MSEFGTVWHARTLNEVDTEIARLATICKVRILDPGVIKRVLANDATVCGSQNASAFSKLRNMLMLHFDARDKAVAGIGEAQTRAVIEKIVEQLKQRIGEGLGGGPAAG